MIHCDSCSADNPDEMRYCTACGGALGLSCSRCGFRSPPGSRFCGQCAAPLQPPASEALSSGGERRQLSLLFCDVVSSSALAERLDPEDMRDLLNEFQSRCADVVRSLDGYVAQYLGDGLLAYFGFPTAHEDGAQRAVLAGLSIVRALARLGAARPELAGPVGLRVRVGIHTGAVVIGRMAGAARHELLAVGETPNIAARVQGAAAPNTVLVSASTHRLVQGYFTFGEPGTFELKGISQPMVLYQVLGETGARGRLDLSPAVALTPFVDRHAELDSLLQRWSDTQPGQRVLVLLGGEAGIGKSRLLRVLRQRLQAEGAQVLEGYCSPLFSGTALHPIVDMFERQLALASDLSDAAKLQRLEEELARVGPPLAQTLSLFAALLSIPLPEQYERRSPQSPQKERQATFDALLTWLSLGPQAQPLLIALEDVQWADPSTLELIGHLLERASPRRIMLLLTRRPEFVAPWKHSAVIELALPRLAAPEAEKLLSGASRSHNFPREIVSKVLAKADGVPLYIEEITKAVLETAPLAKRRGASADALDIPETVQDSLNARLDRLGSGKALLQLAAALGRTFRFSVLSAVSGLEEPALRTEIERLVAAELLVAGGGGADETYSFSHALIQDAAYQSLLRSARQQYHRKIANILAEHFPNLAESQPEVLAQHYVGAGLTAEAIEQWDLAGRRASARSAYSEAIHAYEQALMLLEDKPTLGLPETNRTLSLLDSRPAPRRSESAALAQGSAANDARDKTEVELRVALGVALISTRGYSSKEVEDNYDRAYTLCVRFGEPPLGVLYGVWAVYLVRSDRETTLRLAGMFERLLAGPEDALVFYTAHSALGVRRFFQAEYDQALAHFSAATALSKTQDAARHAVELELRAGFEGYLYPLLYSAWILTVQGKASEAQRTWERALALAEELAYPYGLVMALSFGCVVMQLNGDAARVVTLCQRQSQICAEHGFVLWSALSNIHLGWATSMLSDAARGIPQIEQGLGLLEAIGCFVVYPHHLLSLAEAQLMAVDATAALQTLERAHKFTEGRLAQQHGPALLRLRGEALRQLRRLDEAETSFREALQLATQQRAQLFELQAAVGLARVLRERGRSAEARALLEPLCETAPELSVAPLKAARELLAHLAVI